MQKRYALMAICAGSLVWAAEWPTDGGNPQRTAWQQNEKILAKDNVKNLKVLWKLQLDNKPQEMHSLFPPLIVENIKTSSRSERDRDRRRHFRQHLRHRRRAPASSSGRNISNTLPSSGGAGRGDPLCPPGQTAAPAIGPPTLPATAPSTLSPAMASCIRSTSRTARMSWRRFRSAIPTANTIR